MAVAIAEGDGVEGIGLGDGTGTGAGTGDCHKGKQWWKGRHTQNLQVQRLML